VSGELLGRATNPSARSRRGERGVLRPAPDPISGPRLPSGPGLGNARAATLLENIHLCLKVFPQPEIIGTDRKPAVWFLIEIQPSSDLDCPAIVDPNLPVVNRWGWIAEPLEMLGSVRPLSAKSMARREPLLDLVHQRVVEPCLAQFGKVFKHSGFPGLIAIYILLVTVLKIKRPCLIHAVEEH
jgi:hypothetical protein